MQDQNARPKTNGPGRSSTSCSECQRRKQKCDKQWPCKHCQDRRVPHLCQFKRKSGGPTGGQDNATAEPITIPRTTTTTTTTTVQKRKISEVDNAQIDERALQYASRVLRLEKDLEGLGYINPGRNHKLCDILGDALLFTDRGTTGVEIDYPRGRTDSFPPRPYADVLVHNFMDNINFVYCICHPESLLQSYDNWWATRRTKQDTELEGLLFRIMAISTQFLPTPICERLESEMSEDIVAMKQRFHQSAETLTREIRPGNGRLQHVQQLMLTAAYYKTEAMFVDSWHALSAAIRAAQEINMHRDSAGCDVTEFERELRRQVWISLFTWDRLMAFLFDRPAIIHRASCSLVEPRPELHQDPIHPELPSPLLSRIQDFRLAQILDKYLDENLAETDVRGIVLPLRDINKWLQNLPHVFRVEEPDITWDSQHPRIKHSRLGLHTTAYSCLFHVLHTCLTNDTFPSGSSANERERLREACMEYSIRMTDVVDKLTRYATHSRFHMSYCLFVTSATVCAAMVKDRQRKLPKRSQVLHALGRSCNILDRLAINTAVAKSSAKILKETMSRLITEQPDTSDEIMVGQSMPLEMDHALPEADLLQRDSALGSSVDASSENGEFHLEGDFEVVPDVIPSYTNDFFGGMDLAAIDQMWDWNTLNFDLSGVDGLGGDFGGQPPPPEVH